MKDMKKRFVIMTAVFMALFMAPVYAMAIDVTGTAELDAFTNYVWRGQQLGF